MKRSLNFWLILISLITLPLCVLSWLFDIRGLLYLPGILFFCVQLLVCRKTSYPFVRLIPALVVLLAALTGLCIMLYSSGWDTLGGLILLCACVSPAVAIVAAWLTYALLQRRAKSKEV